MKFIDIYDQYKNLLNKKVQAVFHISYKNPKEKHKYPKNIVKESSVLYLFCRVRDKFDMPEAVFEICKDINDIHKKGALMGVFNDIRLGYAPVVKEPSSGYEFWESPSFTHFEDARHVGSAIHVLEEQRFEIVHALGNKYALAEGLTAPFYPEFPNRNCVCGVDKLYGAKALKQQHSSWCKMSIYDK
jgi:hypothetical protein